MGIGVGFCVSTPIVAGFGAGINTGGFMDAGLTERRAGGVGDGANGSKPGFAGIVVTGCGAGSVGATGVVIFAGRSAAKPEFSVGTGSVGAGLPCPIAKAAPKQKTFNICFLVDQTAPQQEVGSVPSVSPGNPLPPPSP